MRIRQTLTAAILAAAIGGLIVPALAQNRDGASRAPDQGMNMGHHMDRGMTGNGMMDNGMMGGGMMSGGCAGMMQSMNGGGRPNSQWQTNRPVGATPD